MEITDAYQMLGIDQNASAADIDKAYRSRAKQVHPDTSNRDSKCDDENFIKLTEARNTALEHIDHKSLATLYSSQLPSLVTVLATQTARQEMETIKAETKRRGTAKLSRLKHLARVATFISGFSALVAAFYSEADRIFDIPMGLGFPISSVKDFQAAEQGLLDAPKSQKQNSDSPNAVKTASGTLAQPAVSEKEFALKMQMVETLQRQSAKRIAKMLAACIGLFGVLIGVFSLVIKYRIDQFGVAIEDYSDRLSSRRECAREFAWLVDFRDFETISLDEFCDRAARNEEMHLDRLRYLRRCSFRELRFLRWRSFRAILADRLAYINVPLRYGRLDVSDRAKLTFKKAEEHGLVTGLELRDGELDLVFRLKFKPSSLSGRSTA